MSIAGHLIVATGYPFKEAKKIEAFKWEEQETMCNLPDYPIEVQGAVSGMFHNNQYVCGGNFPYTPQCFNPLTGQEAPFNLLHDRGFASSVTIKDEFYIFGGGGESTNLDSYEVISKENGQSEGQIPFLFASVRKSRFLCLY